MTRTLLALAALLVIPFAVLHAAPASAQYSGWQHSGSLFILTKPDGADVRFTTAEGKLLPHQIDEWDAKNGAASIWVRVPRIEGSAKLPLHMYWGKADAGSASNDFFQPSFSAT